MLVIIGFVNWFGCSLLSLFTYFPFFSFYECVCVYVSLCDFVCLGLLVPFVWGFCLFFVLFFVVVCFLFMTVYVYVSLCDFVCLDLLLPFSLGF